ncbi:MAG: 16S rRNA (adenine(1518)-N(6)/adenine(1519)-N(6))-dimethyltransferase RsmA [Bacteroidales bacterium]|nr:16S rRNA (adenine(1518)-N(6)/adenine(1519)-N(6))-dimethyltransferase RsmA [Bacteroidales bacterium]
MVRPKKHLGQHFLTDPNIARKTVESLRFPMENLLEIGPGKGILTALIMAKDVKDFRVVEIDSESAEYLRLTYPGLQQNIIEDDFLSLDLSLLFQHRFSVIGNFPYNISSQILFKILEHKNQVDEVVGMFQKEVAERIASAPGNKKYGILSVLIQAFFDIEYLFTVNEGVFFPPPKVKSAVIRLRRNSTMQLTCDERMFFELVKTAFNQRRKVLKNALSRYAFKSDSKLDILLRRRAEELDVQDFELLTSLVVQKS